MGPALEPGLVCPFCARAFLLGLTKVLWKRDMRPAWERFVDHLELGHDLDAREALQFLARQQRKLALFEVAPSLLVPALS